MQSQGEHIKTWRRRWFVLKQVRSDASALLYLLAYQPPRSCDSAVSASASIGCMSSVSSGCSAWTAPSPLPPACNTGFHVPLCR